MKMAVTTTSKLTTCCQCGSGICVWKPEVLGWTGGAETNFLLEILGLTSPGCCNSIGVFCFILFLRSDFYRGAVGCDFIHGATDITGVKAHGQYCVGATFSSGFLHPFYGFNTTVA